MNSLPQIKVISPQKIKCILNNKRQLKKFQGTQVQESAARKFELKLLLQRTTGQKKIFFTVTFYYFFTFYIFYHFCNTKHKLFITFLSIGLHVTKIYHKIQYIPNIISVNFLNLNPAYKNIDERSMDTGLKLDVYERLRRRCGHLLNGSCS